MKHIFLHQKKLRLKRLLWIAIPIAVLLLMLGAFWALQAQMPDPEKLYAAAVADAVNADPDEIEPLVELLQSDAMTSWDHRGRVLLLSWHNNPERFLQGEEIVQSGGEIWTFTDREIAAWYAKNSSDVTDWTLRMEQLIGLPPGAGYTHVSGFWADPADVIRPAYVTDVTEQMQTEFPAGTPIAFQTWFADNSTFSYQESAYPWTRLGYTYDWADNNIEYGLTEFLIQKYASVQVAFTVTTSDFLSWLDQGAIVDQIVDE